MNRMLIDYMKFASRYTEAPEKAKKELSTEEWKLYMRGYKDCRNLVGSLPFEDDNPTIVYRTGGTKSYFTCEFASNGWMDWYCHNCKELIANNDVHGGLDYKYCPYCGCEFVSKKEFEKLKSELESEEQVAKYCDNDVIAMEDAQKRVLETVVADGPDGYFKEEMK